MAISPSWSAAASGRFVSAVPCRRRRSSARASRGARSSSSRPEEPTRGSPRSLPQHEGLESRRSSSFAYPNHVGEVRHRRRRRRLQRPRRARNPRCGKSPALHGSRRAAARVRGRAPERRSRSGRQGEVGVAVKGAERARPACSTRCAKRLTEIGGESGVRSGVKTETGRLGFLSRPVCGRCWIRTSDLHRVRRAGARGRRRNPARHRRRTVNVSQRA
jgi:hypothetical protein